MLLFKFVCLKVLNQMKLCSQTVVIVLVLWTFIKKDNYFFVKHNREKGMVLAGDLFLFLEICLLD